ncbi:MAG: HEAT repeat domain-containing protein [Pseudobdellovibrio sp.]
MKLVLAFIVFSMSVTVWSYVPQVNDLNFTSQMSRAQNSSLPMTQRWDAVIKATELANAEQMKDLLNLSRSRDWFVRNALLVGLDKTGNDLVYEKAAALMNDKALVVRSAAVDVLSRLNSRKNRELLAREMTKNYNFVGQKSLWIRSQIMKGLVKNPQSFEKEFFSKMLFDQDTEIANMSTQALEKITNIRFDGPQKLTAWRKLAKDRKWF